MVDAGPQMRSANCYYNNFHIRPSAVSGKKTSYGGKSLGEYQKIGKKEPTPFSDFLLWF